MLLEKRIPLRYLFRKAARDTFFVVIITAVIEGFLSTDPTHLPRVPGMIPAFLGTAISLILSFKLNQSYDRWWEARKIWGAIVNDSRSLTRQLLSFAGEASEIARRMARRQIAWCYCLGQSLRGLDWTTGSVEHLSEADVAIAKRHRNKSVALLQLHASDLAALADNGALTDFQRVTVDQTLTRLTDSMGMAERIKNTVFPRTYRLTLHAFIYLFVILLSFALHDIKGAWQILVTTVIAIPFLFLEKTAFHMQDPFENRPTDTSVTAIARTIEINIRQLLGDAEVPEPYPPADYYVM